MYCYNGRDNAINTLKQEKQRKLNKSFNKLEKVLLPIILFTLFC